MSDPQISTSYSKPSWRPLVFGALGVAVVVAGLAVGYYAAFFRTAQSIGLALGLLLVVGLHLWAGWRAYAAQRSFPWRAIVVPAVALALLRLTFVYTVLQHHVPPSRVFHYPGRAAWFIGLSSVMLVLLGYGLAQYWHSRHSASSTFVKTRHDTPSADVAADKNARQHMLTFRSEGREVILPVAELLYVQANGEYMLYCSTEQRYTRYQRMKDAAAELAPFGFVRVHRSYLVARERVRSRSTQELELSDGTVVPVSRSYRGALDLLGLGSAFG